MHGSYDPTPPHLIPSSLTILPSTLRKLTKNLLPRLPKLPLNRLPDPLTPNDRLTPILLRAIQEPLMIPGDWVLVVPGRRPVRADCVLEVERPQQLGDAEEHVALREVDARADAAAGAVAVVVAPLGVACRVLGRECGVRGIAVRVEGFRVLVADGIHVQAPRVEDHDGAFGQELAVDPVICSRVSQSSGK